MILQKQKIEQQIQQLANLSFSKYTNLRDIGVLGGQSGVALFQFYCSKYFDDNTFSKNGVDIISNCIEMINSGFSYPTYCNGIAGFGWALQHLHDKGFIELDTDELLMPFDDYLNSQMELDMAKGEYDILHGALGYGVYFLKRYQSTKSIIQKNRYAEILNNCVTSLEKIAIIEGELIKWEAILDSVESNKRYNLSLSHGMASIVYFLTRLYTVEIEPKRVKILIQGATRYMLSFEKDNRKETSLFPSWVDSNKKLEYNSRLAWCYGDIGLGLVFANTGKALLDSNLEEKGLTILQHSSKRKSKDNTSVVDAGFCHGSFGNAHIYNKLTEIEPTYNFENASNFWLKDGLKRYFEDSNEPYKQWNPIESSYNFSPNLLEGISGIGLSMIDYLSEEKNSWDECLFLR